MTTAPNPLPHVGICPECGDEVRLRVNNRTYAHGTCPGAGEYTPPLPPTFLRWIWSHRARRDTLTNPITHLAEFTVGLSRGCCYKSIALVPWTSAEELHEFKHSLPRAPGCDWLCRDIQRAADTYADLTRHLHALPPAA
ncbi:MAG TPA: hypothetical protein VGL02_07965 [Streptomyces sp.]